MTSPLERDTQLARLVQLLDSARSGHGSLVFVGGEAGIGKSTLVNMFIAHVDGARIAIGRCDALATPRALGPVLDIAAELGVTADVGRDALFGALVADVDGDVTTVLIVEDAHWADDASIELLAMLGRRVADLPLLIVVTHRDDDVSAGSELRNAIGDLAPTSSTVCMGLAPLSSAAVEALANRSGVSAADLYRRTGGNPFFVTEALAASDVSIPTSVRLAVLARAARLAPTARAVLDAVSVIPGRAETWLLAAVCGQPQSSVEQCVAAGMLTTDRSTYAFRHEIARLAIDDELGDGERRSLHRRVVAALASRDSVDPARVAHHAEAAGDDEALAKWARRALLVAAERTAHREAVEHGEQALAAREFLTADELAELHTKLATSLIAVARADDASDLALVAAQHWHAAGDGPREAEALLVLSSALASLGHTERSMEPLGRAIEILERYEPGPELTLACIRLASAHMLARDRDPAVEWGERAIALAERQRDPSLLARALIETGIADVMDERFEGLARVRQGIELGRRRGLPGVVAHGLSHIGSGCGELRRYDEAVPALVEGVAFSEAHYLESNRRYQLAWLARCHFDLGRWDEAESMARAAIAGSRSVAIARFVGVNTLGWLRARRGEVDVFSFLDEALFIARQIGHLQRLWPVAAARAEAGWLEDALDPHVPLLEEVFELAIECRHAIAVGELGMWLHRAGRLEGPPALASPPFAAWISGEWMQSVAGFRQWGCPYEAACVLADAGDLASGREANATFRRLGAHPMAARTRKGLGLLGVRAVSSRQSAHEVLASTSGLTDREIEVLRLVVAGFTNPQIAGTLYISRKTAEHHVSSILMKLGATKRSEAAATAVRLGLAG